MLRRALATAGAVIAAAAFVGAAVPTSRAAGANPFPFVGTVALFDAQGHPYDAGSGAYVPRLVALDPGLRRLVVGLPYEDRLFLVDPQSLEQTAGFPTGYPIGIGVGGPTAYDAVGHRLFLGGTTSCPRPATCFSVGQVHVVDVGRQASGPTFTLPTRFGDLEMITMQYSSVHGHRVLFLLLAKQGQINTTILLALDADRLDRPDALLWSYDVSSSCPGFTGGANPPYLGIARTGDFAYFACKGRTRPDGKQLTHHSALVVRFGGSDPTQADPARFRTDVSAFAGNMTFAFMVGDPANERLVVVLAGGSNNRIAVFDPVHEAWTGSAPVTGTFNMWGVAVDPSGSGRAYAVLENRKMLMTDVSGLPLPQGQEYDLGVVPGTAGPPVYDPVTRHLFVAGPRFTDNGDGANTYPALMRVYRDDVPHADKPPVADPDAGTDDVEEAEGRTPVTYSGGASAYGARVDLVGGLRATPAGPDLNNLNSISSTFAVVAGLAAPFGVPVNGPPQVSGNDRSTALGWVQTTQVTPSAATAQAVGLAYDEATSSDLANLGAEQAAQNQVPETKQSYCSDTQERPQHASQPGSAGDCDLGAQRAGADATGEGPSTTTAARIASGRSHTSVVRSRNGAVAFAEAIARDIALPMPDGGQLHIDEARNAAEARAHGRTGTARSSFSPTLRGVTITDAAGRTVYSCDDCDPQAVADAITARDPDHLGAVVPRRSTGALSATPKGAQALVLKDVYQYWNDFVVNNDTTKEVAVLELVYYDDGNEPSRLVVKLAGVLAESHFTVGLPPGDVPETLGGLDGADTLASPGAGLGFVGADALAGSPGRGGAGSGRNRQRLYTLPAGALGGFLFHRPGEALLFVLVWALLATPLWLGARRRSLLVATRHVPSA